MHKFEILNKAMAVSCCCTLAVWTAAAQSAFVYQYDGMNETNRVAVKPGVFADYENNASNKTFYANYRILIDQIRAINPQAKIIVCTPRKSYGFGRYLPPKETLPKGGIYLREYAEAVRAIAKKEGFALADFYANCGEESELADLSIDVALHPNDPGYQRMADEIIKAFYKIIPKQQ